MSDQQSSYRQIFKATSIFGGVQVFNILIGIVKSKVAALFLGTEGMGVIGLLNSTIDLVRNISGLGINTSAVRSIAHASSVADTLRIRSVVTTVRRVCWVTGFIGLVSVIILAPLLSQWTFGNRDYTWSFIFLSTIPLFTSLSLGQLAVLQGLRKITYLAKANLYGGFVSLVFLVPVYYYFGIAGIVPILIIASFISLLFSFYYARKLEIENVYQTIRETYSNGAGMIKLGVMLTLSALTSSLVAYTIRIYISHDGGLSDVGLYSVGQTLITTYIGLVFTAMGTDFFPRLSAISNDNNKMSELINNQAEIGVLILTPMIIVFMLFAPYLLTLLYSDKFTPITTMLQWSMLGVLLQSCSWPLAFGIIAKAKNKLFLFNELSAGVYFVIFSVLGYNIWGLEGLGVAYLLLYVCYLAQLSVINKVLYNIKLCSSCMKLLLTQASLVVLTFLTIQYIESNLYMYVLGVTLAVISMAVSYNGIEKRVGIKEIIKRKLKSRM